MNQEKIYVARGFEFRTNNILETYIFTAPNVIAARQRGEEEVTIGYLDRISVWEIKEDEATELVAEGAEDLRLIAKEF